MNRRTLVLAGLGAMLLALMVGALLLHVPGEDNVGTRLRTDIFVGVLVTGVIVYLVSVRLLLSGGLSRHAIWIVLGVAIAMRAAILPVPPFLSSDIYRYVWDGQVQAAGINPYLYIPADPALVDLRDQAVYPMINRADYARTIYPPAAEAIFAIIGRITSTVIGMKLAMAAFEIVAMLCMLRLLSIVALPPERLLIYAWNPLVLWSFAGDGHVDAAVVALLALALLARAGRRDGVAGVWLAAATLVKFVPVVVAPAFLHGGKPWRSILAGTVVIVVLYGLYISAGRNVLGFLPAYGTEEGLNDGSGFWLLAGLSHFVSLPPYASAIYGAIVAVSFAALSLRIAQGRTEGRNSDAVTLCRDVAILAAVAMVAISPHYTWYFAWLAVPCVVAPLPAVIWLSVSPVVLYLDPFGEHFLWPSIVYVPAIGLAVVALWRRRQSHTAMAASEGIP